MSTKKYLSLERLAEYDALLKAKIAQDDAATLDAAKDYINQKFDGHTHSWNELTDKPFGEEGSGAVIEWDCNTEGRDTFSLGAQTFVKFSDNTPDSTELVGGTLKATAGGQVQESPISNIQNGNGCYFAETVILVVKDTNVEWNGHSAVAPSTGMYIMSDASAACDSVTIVYGGGSSIKTLDEKYIPDTIARISDIQNIDLTPYETKTDAESKLAEAKAYADGKDTAIQAAQTAANNAASAASTADEKAVKAQGDVDALKTYVGTIPTTATATDVIGYVQEKTSGIATSENLQELTNRVAEAETDIGNIQKDYLTSADKTELQTNIDTVSSAVELLTNGVDAETVDGVNDLIAYVNEHGSEVTGMKADIQANADAISELAPVAKTGSWNALKDKPFGDSDAILIEWDGNTEGLEAVINENENGGMYRVSGLTPSVEEFIGAIIVEHNGNPYELRLMEEYQITEDDIVYGDNAIAVNTGNICIAYEDGATLLEGSIVLPKAGLYFYNSGIHLPENHDGEVLIFVYSMTYGGDSSIKTLDEKYIPDTIARVVDQEALALRMADAEDDIADIKDDYDNLYTNIDNAFAHIGEFMDAHAGDYTNAQIDAAIKVVSDNVATLNDTCVTDEEFAQAIADAKTDSSNKDAVVLAEAQKGITALDTRVVTLEAWHENFEECTADDINALFA